MPTTSPNSASVQEIGQLGMILLLVIDFAIVGATLWVLK